MHYQWDFVFLLRYAPLFWNGVLVTLSYTGAFYAEIFRGGIISIEAGQWDAARALGLRRWQVDAAGDPAAGGAADDPVIGQPVDHAVEEYVPGIDDRGAGSAVERHAGDGGYLLAAAGLHGGRPDLLRVAVSEHAAGSGIRAAVGVTAAVGNGL
jgi:hypothetical protein